VTLYPSTCHGIDALIGGGFPTGVVSHIYGEPGSGKTSLCIQLATSVIRSEKRVIFIASDPFQANASLRSLRQILQRSVKNCSFRGQKLRPAASYAAQYQENSEGNVGLIIFDAVTTYYRLEQAKDTEIRSRQAFANQVLLLLGLAKKYDLALR